MSVLTQNIEMINGINYKKFKEEFLSTELGKQVRADFDEITCEQVNYPSIIFMKNKFGTTCRELLGNNDLQIRNPKTTLSIVTFYYLRLLQEINPKAIYDLGCGWNIWKKYIPNIVGVDSQSKYADLLDNYNLDFVSRHQRKFDAAFAINMDVSLDDIVTFENIEQQVLTFSTMIRPGGRGYIALPALGLYRFTPKSWYPENNCTELSAGEVVRDKLLKLPLSTIALDCEFDIFRNASGHDGEFRFVFEVPTDVEV